MRKDSSVQIHPMAVVSPEAQIGSDVKIGPFCVVGANVVIKDGCTLHQHATVEGHTTLGEGCEVYPQAVLGMPPQDLKYSGEKTALEIGRNNVFREMVTAHPGTANGGGVTRIGDGNLILIGAHIAHDCHIGSHCIIANYVQFAGHVRLEDNVNMGGHCAVHHFVTVGKHAFVGGMTRVSADVPPFMVVVAARGSRSEVRMVNGVGLQRSGYSHEDIGALKDAFMRVFSRRARMSGVGICERVQALLDDDATNRQVRYLCDSLMRSFTHGRHGRYLESLRSDSVNRKTWKLENKFALQVNVKGKGAVRRLPSPINEQTHETVELMAEADPGWGFAGWNGNLSGRNNPARVVLDTDKTVTAMFEQQEAG